MLHVAGALVDGGRGQVDVWGNETRLQFVIPKLKVNGAVSWGERETEERRHFMGVCVLVALSLMSVALSPSQCDLCLC